MKMIYITAQECIGNWVGHFLHVTNVVEVMILAWSVLVKIGGESKSQRFVVNKYIELTTFDKMVEVLDGQVRLCTARSSRSNVLYRVYSGRSFLEN